ncbi:MAG: hypothetical protein LBJ96_05215 [Holosporaceae bacterium]|nr:hypothetical protein [Holosporaceae bacterium]
MEREDLINFLILQGRDFYHLGSHVFVNVYEDGELPPPVVFAPPEGNPADLIDDDADFLA